MGLVDLNYSYIRGEDICQQNFSHRKNVNDIKPPEPQLEIAIDEDSINTQLVVQGLQSATKSVTESIDNLAGYLDSLTTTEPQLLPQEIILANIIDYQEMIIQYSNDLLTRTISSTNKLTTASQQELQSLTQQLNQAVQQQDNIDKRLFGSLEDKNNRLQRWQSKTSESQWEQYPQSHNLLTAAELSDEEIFQQLWNGVNKKSLLSTNDIVSTNQNTEANGSSGTVGYQYCSGSRSDAMLTCYLLSITILLKKINLTSAGIQADVDTMLTDKMNLVVQLNQLLAPLDSFYKEAIVGYNNIKNDDKESDITTINFDDEEIAEAANNSKSGFNEEVVRKNGKNIWYVSVDEIPEAARSYFVVIDGIAQVTSNGIQDFIKYVSDATASVIPSYGDDTNIYSIFGESALESAQISSFETGLNNIISQLQSLQSSAMSAATSYLDNDESITKFFDDWLEMYERLFTS